VSDNNGQVQRLQAEAYTMRAMIAELRRERDARVTVEDIPYWMRWVRLTKGFWPTQDDAHSALHGILAWRNRTAPAVDRVQIGNGTRKCPVCGRMGCGFGCEGWQG